MPSDREEFLSVFQEIASDILERDLPQHHFPEYVTTWIRNLLNENVPGGKLNRGLSVEHSLRQLVEGRQLTSGESFKARVLGWCIELLQAFFLVADDIMDSSVTRRGKPCWYRQPHPMGNSPSETIGTTAINDSFILESLIYRVLRRHFREEPYYADICDLFHDVTLKTTYGQLLDLTSNLPGGRVDLSLFTLDNYYRIVKYKTAFYSFQLPVALAMLLAGLRSTAVNDAADAILLPMGEYFQIQDDFLDCYGAPEVIGKIGRDIEENKCSWLICQALLHASPDQRAQLEEHYGRDAPEHVVVVKKIFADINVTKIFKDYEESSYQALVARIQQTHCLPRGVFLDFLSKIYKRSL
eukprot:TRINITY_DN31394_c0_g1_i1.p1 TRINITY_DN31394_c0_g1~~TRINITY_DN31394_c0_g1_i1.p1  ORF type:complete len:364 (+),score=132.33 TRINITY_DN31394_c0_g1_i1:29-1093(+)